MQSIENRTIAINFKMKKWTKKHICCHGNDRNTCHVFEFLVVATENLCEIHMIIEICALLQTHPIDVSLNTLANQHSISRNSPLQFLLNFLERRTLVVPVVSRPYASYRGQIGPNFDIFWYLNELLVDQVPERIN